MSGQDSAAERTEEATPRRREKARKEGEVARSQEVAVALGMLVVAAVILWWFAYVLPGLIEFSRSMFKMERWADLSTTSAPNIMKVIGWQVFRISIPVGGFVALMGILASLLQVGVQFNLELTQPKPERLNPMNWFKKTFSVEIIVEFAKSTFKAFGIGLIAIFSLEDELFQLHRLVEAPMIEIGRTLQDMAYIVFVRVAAAMVIVAMLDILWTRYQFEKKIRMTKQEIKDEMKDSEGNPLLKSAMRQRARERVKDNLVRSVREATVVVTNPTHYAVALKYERNSDPAPMVLIKGKDFKALRIREIAKAHNIPVIEDKPVARALFAAVKEGKTVPVELYRAVARVLAIVFKQQQKVAQRREVAS